MTAILADQIMDELMEGSRTALELSEQLGCQRDKVQRAVYLLAAQGLVEEAGSRTGKTAGRPQIVWKMARTRRSIA
jgi:predicted ArsR family transcriptional regulator